MLKSVEENKINTLPVVTSQPVRYFGEFNINSVIVQPENAIIPHSPPPVGSPSRRQQATLANQQAYMRRPVIDRMNEARSMELLSRPTEAAVYGGVAREFIANKYLGSPTHLQTTSPSPPLPSYAPPSASISVSGTRPIERYGRNWRDSKVVRGSRLQPNILPKVYRKNPKMFPPISQQDTEQGVLGLVQKGFIPSFVDVSAAFTSNPAPLQQAPSTFHHFNDQFQKKSTQIATHAFNLSQVKLDLGEVLLDRETMNEYEVQMLLKSQEEKQQQLLPPASHGGSQQQIASEGGMTLQQTAFAFPQLMPSDAEMALTLQGRDDIDDLLTSHLDQPEEEKGPRDYDELLDTYSLHQFLIRKGKTLSSTPEFQSFSRKHHHLWGPIKQVLRELEAICREYGITVATIHGARVVELAEDELIKLTPEVLFRCFSLDIHSPSDPLLRSLLASPSKARYSMGGDLARVMAALKIQSTWRMFIQRRLYLHYRYRHTKAVLIQRAFRRFRTILGTREKIARRWNERVEKWKTNVQEVWKKGYAGWQKKKRVHIHLPSISSEPYQRQALFNFSVRENAQLSRLCDVKDPNVDVLYLSPFALNTDVQSYYLKLLEVGGITSTSSRVKILLPENSQRFPEHFSLAKLVLYSPKCLRKIREHLRGRPAVLIPGEVGMEDLALAVELNVPLLSSMPEGQSLFSSKSGSKRIFAASEVPVAPGAHDIYDSVDLYTYLAKLIVDHLGVERWIFKIDNESGGRGLACMETAHFRVVQSLREEKQQHSNRWSLPEVLANAQERVVVSLKKSLPKKVVLATPGLYDSKWSNYAAAFFRVGGVIEAAPPSVIGSPSVNLLVEPDGTVTILNSHDQVFSSAFVFSGANFPSSAPASLLHTPALSIGRSCFREGILGYVGVDFIAWSEGPGAAPKMWAVDLNLRMTPTQSSFMLFDFLLKGRYVYQSTNADEKRLPLHLRPAARYLIPATSSLQANPSTPSRGGSRSGLVSMNQSPSARLFGSSSATSVSSSREGSRPTSGQSTPKLPGIDRKSNGAKENAAPAPLTGKEESRFYSCVPYLYQPHLSTVQFGSFFNLCRLKGVSFDVRARVGTVFMMMDSLASGSLGMLCVGQAAPPLTNSSMMTAVQAGTLPPSPLHAMQLLVDALSFLNEQVSSLRFGAHLYDSESNLQQMLVAYKGLCRAQSEALKMMIMEQQSQLVDLSQSAGPNQ